jgi:hypothetical protein
MTESQVFISYSGHDSFEAELLQFAIEAMLDTEQVKAWTFQRDQPLSEKTVPAALKQSVQNSVALVFLLSPSTIDSGASQWMELAYADAFDVKTFILLHHINYDELKKKERGVPPLLLASQCNPASQWKEIIEDLRKLVREETP